MRWAVHRRKLTCAIVIHNGFLLCRFYQRIHVTQTCGMLLKEVVHLSNRMLKVSLIMLVGEEWYCYSGIKGVLYVVLFCGIYYCIILCHWLILMML